MTKPATDQWPSSLASATANGVRALWGAIGPSIVGASVEYTAERAGLWAFHSGDVSSDELEALDDAVGELASDYAYLVPAHLHLIKAPPRILSAPGVWIYIRLGYIGVGPGDERYDAPPDL